MDVVKKQSSAGDRHRAKQKKHLYSFPFWPIVIARSWAPSNNFSLWPNNLLTIIMEFSKPYPTGTAKYVHACLTLSKLFRYLDPELTTNGMKYGVIITNPIDNLYIRYVYVELSVYILLILRVYVYRCKCSGVASLHTISLSFLFILKHCPSFIPQ